MVRHFESEIYRKDKSTIWISENARAVRDESGELIYFEGMVEDITERKRLESELQASEQNILAVINNIDDSIWSVDSEYRLITFNATFSRIFNEFFGVKVKHGDVLTDHMPPEWRPEDITFYDRALAGERFVVDRRYEIFQVERYYEISYNPIRSDDCITGVAVFRQRTLRKSIGPRFPCARPWPRPKRPNP